MTSAVTLWQPFQSKLTGQYGMPRDTEPERINSAQNFTMNIHIGKESLYIMLDANQPVDRVLVEW